ncbi:MULTISPECIES: isochorismatase family protein [unclassified Herbaspirillum]|uniref:isochorismatase family protein n=1 Tax=unclassified Herbaspirillum TaxID=2624150 RepID=UPI001154AB11|nr:MULTISPECIES: isochorismatase family protein [unclassified Herbaspirillum]MBB5393340.1 nicotinamidase-related amidase [Herbaspirillum sp. SJZ102]TQK03911.1 nicotinamidase-related amidase [Herbaspirillum sp. SJZ130]TQK08643.1 nicotinamidase-related amidase [Herbaspirillum sp. SJZ106]TWC71914.1 nicotinamidase-related amidase [Herbaspirillum sp. SJZ099]
MLIDASQSVLLVVDLQQKLLPAIHDNQAILAQAVRMATIAGLLGVPVIGTEQIPDKLGPNHPDIRPLCGRTLAKSHFDACAEGLLPALPASARQIVIAGCEAHICMLQTALSLLEHGYQVLPLLDACGSRKPGDRQAAFARLQHAGAVPVTVEMVAYEWLRDARHPLFRDVLKLIK